MLDRSQGARPPAPMRVWDLPVRLFHWSLVACFGVAWLTPQMQETVHASAGYAAIGLVAFRLAWGVVGTPYARFTQFVRPAREVWCYLTAIAAGNEGRYVGHNPAGGAMIVLLLVVMLATGISGWLMTTDTFFGVRWVEATHNLSAHALLGLAVVHVAGVAVASWHHRENLVRAMFTGRKRPPAADDVA